MRKRTGQIDCPVRFLSVPGMAQILLVKVQSRAFVAKCSEPQAESSNAQVKAVV